MELFMSLKKLTDSIHRKAEQTKWAQHMLSGNMTNPQYGQYLYNQSYIYSALETALHEKHFWEKHPDLKSICRSIPISSDMAFYEYLPGFENTSILYEEYVKTLDVQQLLAHLYVRHFGDMYGGQMIVKKLPEIINHPWMYDSDGTFIWDPESGKSMYRFDDKKDQIPYIRNMLSTDMADEAIACFQFAIDLFSDLEKRFDL
jgi:heme oxygenase